MDVCMDGWLAGCIDACIDAWMHGWTLALKFGSDPIGTRRQKVTTCDNLWQHVRT